MISARRRAKSSGPPKAFARMDASARTVCDSRTVWRLHPASRPNATKEPHKYRRWVTVRPDFCFTRDDLAIIRRLQCPQTSRPDRM